MKDNGFWARHLIQSEELNADPSRILMYEKRVDALTPKDVQAVAKKYLEKDNFAQFVLNPEN